MEIIIGREGEQALPIDEKTVSRRHCKIYDVGPDKYIVENISESGVTKVDGMEIVSAHAGPGSVIQLGPKFSAKLSDLIKFAPKAPPQPAPRPQPAPGPNAPQPQQQPPTFDISHLQWIWEEQENHTLRQAEHSRKVGMVRAVLPVFTMTAFLLRFAGDELNTISWIFTGIGVLGTLYGFFGMSKSETALQKKQRMDAFEDAWVCPNPACGKSIPAKNFNLLYKNYQRCPHCKCNWVYNPARPY